MVVSPVNFTIKRATFLGEIRKKYSKIQKTKKCQMRRIQLKSEKCNINGEAEVLEGTTYENNIDRQSDIGQIAAVTKNETVSSYVMYI